MLKSISVFLALVTLANASVEIYQDKVKLNYLPSQKLIGFNTNLQASNVQGSLKVIKGSCENLNTLACKSINKVQELTFKNNSLKKQKTILELTLNEACFDTKDALKTIAYIEKLSDKIVAIDKMLKHNNFLINKERAKRVLNSQAPYLLSALPKSKIDIEFAGVRFGSKYELNVDKKLLKHKLSFVNRSGIDIKTTQARIFDRRMVGIPNNYKFQPRLIYTRPNRVMKKARSSQPMMAMDSMMEEKSFAGAVPVATKESTRTYTIKNFSLLSNGSTKDFTVEQKSVKIELSKQWNAWEYKVFDVAKVGLDEVLEARSINLVYKNSMTKNVQPRREGKSLVLNIAQEYDINARRESIPNYSKDKGFFNSDTQVQYGYKLVITNLSKVTKNINVVEKIPVSRQEEIRVKFDGVLEKNGSKANYKYDKKLGKVKFTVKLKANESRIYTYGFSIKHPKEMPVHY